MNIDYLQIKLKELKLFLEMKYKAKTSLDVERLYLSFLKEEIKMGTNYPNYEKDREFYYLGNCYTYALGLRSISSFIEQYKYFKIDDLFPFNCGFMHEICKAFQSKEELLERFYQDCEALGILVYETGINTPISYGGYKIALFVSCFHNKFNDFHFVRQNEDGSWSHKLGYFNEPQLIEFSEQLNGHYEFLKTFEIVKPVIRERRK